MTARTGLPSPLRTGSLPNLEIRLMVGIRWRMRQDARRVYVHSEGRRGTQRSHDVGCKSNYIIANWTRRRCRSWVRGIGEGNGPSPRGGAEVGLNVPSAARTLFRAWA